METRYGSVETKYLKNQLTEFLNNHDSSCIIHRQNGNHDLFFRLYKAVNYAPEEEVLYQAWKTVSTKTWQLQDSILPGTLTAGTYKSVAKASCGTLPLSPTVMYGHSFCMVKDLPAALLFYIQAIQSLQWALKVPGIHYYAGGYSKQSGFTPRLHLQDGYTPVCDDQITIHTNRINLKNLKRSSNNDYHYTIQQEYCFKDIGDDRLSKLILLLNQPHPIFANYHTVRSYTLKNIKSQNCVAYILAYDSPDRFTAINIFRIQWIFLKSGVCQESVFEFLATIPEFANCQFEVVSENGKTPPQNLSNMSIQQQAIWTITPVSSLFLLRGTITQAVINLLEKYQHEEIKRTMIKLMV